MKKLLFMFALVAFSVSFVACGSKTAKDAATDESATATEVTTPAKEEVAAEGDVLAQYEGIINKIIKMYEDGTIQNGTATEEYTKLAQEMAGIAEKLQTEMQSMTPEQAQKFADLGQRLADAATKAMNP